ncbi:unnamed protein product [Polarella glacialis]|uniref:AAA+ ATPase domain-containing protein n=1 Tax=Polarella glacialis TaxID=89957 RepID=A0A813H7P0_POLGL|nr:unnamed protein product [Polarella glacialis]
MHRALDEVQHRIPQIYSTQPLVRASSGQLPGLNQAQSDFVSEVVRARGGAVVPILPDPERQLAEQLSRRVTSESRTARLRKFGATTLYHQTDPESAQMILDTGRMFRGTSGALGGGIYFAGSPEDTERKAHHRGVILECRVYLGKIKRLSACDGTVTFSLLDHEGFDSVLFTGFPSGPEYVVYNFDQVEPVGPVNPQAAELRPSPFPLILWGPPGTGKTTTLVAAIRQVLSLGDVHVLAAAPSNAAADLICERLRVAGVGPAEMLRLNAVMRNPGDVPTTVLPYSKRSLAGDFEIPPLDSLMKFKIIVSTCSTSGYLASRGPLPGWFTHLFIDEAAQALEPEAFIPVTVLEPGGLLVLAGDHHQLGPVVRSPVAVKYGLDVSLMERVVQRLTPVHSRVFTLTTTYRAHPSIAKLYNETVYGGILQCASPSTSYDMLSWPGCSVDLDGNRQPVIFHHIESQESRTKGSPSWVNQGEVLQVRAYLRQLVAFGISPQDVGIISPYQLQCKRLRIMCGGEEFPAQVGTTELFQGQEKRIILISTVRSRCLSEVPQDLRFALGFVGSYKRSNVAMSRARSALILVGNLRLLSMDAHWNAVIRIAKRRGYCCGADFVLQQPRVVDDGVHVAQQAGANEEAVGRPWRDFE